MDDLAAKARRLLELHEADDVLTCVNVWDVASARVVAGAGARALATASWSIAAAHGFPDGERIPRELMLDAIRRIAASTDLPVSADLERGYGDPGETVALAIEAGAVGCNLEDSIPEGLREIEDAAARVAAARSAADAAGIPFVINARTDSKDPAEALRRGRAYLDAGADCVFAVMIADPEAIRRLAAELDGRVSVLCRPGSPSVAELAALGVARVSVGPGSLGAAYAALERTATELLAGGGAPADMAFRPPSS